MQNQRFPGGHGGGETPGPIPNPEAKPSSADDTALATGRESRTLPGFKEQERPERRSQVFFCISVEDI